MDEGVGSGGRQVTWRDTFAHEQQGFDVGDVQGSIPRDPLPSCGQYGRGRRCTRPLGHDGPHQVASWRSGPSLSWEDPPPDEAA
jgi:hypothetical protein